MINTKSNHILEISQATKADATAMIEYLNIVGGESDNLLFGANGFTMSVEDEERFLENMAKSATSAMLIGKIDGEVVSTAGITSSPRERIAHIAELGISVKQKYWGEGIGSHMMSAVIDFCRGNGVTEVIHLGVKEDNKVARRLYEKFGFVEVGRHKNFFKISDKYYDEILMDLHIQRNDME